MWFSGPLGCQKEVVAIVPLGECLQAHVGLYVRLGVAFDVDDPLVAGRNATGQQLGELGLNGVRDITAAAPGPIPVKDGTRPGK